MVRSKPSSSKKQKRGPDFKKIKRKIGRKLPPPKNTTNTQIKSKAIILPEQSMVSERVGLAVSKKGLTLKELLQQTSHHNANTRRDALIGIRDLALKYPEELRSHKLAIIEKLRERIGDNNKVVRETLYQLLKSVIFPGFKEDIPGPIISLTMAYIFNAMTHLGNDIRLMAFKFFDLIVLHYPSSFFLYAEKVLQNYKDILRNNHIYLQDKSNLKNALVGLVRCLSLLPDNKRNVDPSNEQNNNARGTLHSFETEVPKEHIGSSVINNVESLVPILVTCFHDVTPMISMRLAIDTDSYECMLYVLQSIVLAVKFLLYGVDKPHASFGVSTPLTGGPDVTMWGEKTLPALLKKLLEKFPLNKVHCSAEKDDDRYFVLNVGITEIFLHLSELIGAPILMERFVEFIANSMSGQISSNMRLNLVPREKHLISLLPFIPRLASQLTGTWKSRLLKAFTDAFKCCKPESALNLACLSAIEEMLLPEKMQIALDECSTEMLGYQVTWIRQLPDLLLRLGDKHPSSTKVVLQLQLRLGQCAPMNSTVSMEYDNLQWPLRGFYSKFPYGSKDKGEIQCGPFSKLPRDCQELAVCCLYYFSNLNSLLLESLAFCCLCDELELCILLRIIEVLHSAYKSGHVQITDQISFLVTLLARFKVSPEKYCFGGANGDKISNHGTFKAITSAVCSCLSQMGDSALMLQILQKIISNEMLLKLPLDNMRAMLRALVTLDPRPAKLTEETLSTLSCSLSEYLIEAASYIPENEDENATSDQIHICQYYIQPCIFLFVKSDKFLSHVLNLLGSSIMEYDSSSPHHGNQYALEPSSRMRAVASILIFFHKDVKLHRSLSSCKAAVKHILQNMLIMQASNETHMTLEDRHKMQCKFDQLKIETSRLHLWNTDDLKRISEVN